MFDDNSIVGKKDPSKQVKQKPVSCLYSLWSRMMIQRSPTWTRSAGDANQHLHLVFQEHCDRCWKAPNERPRTCLFLPTFAGVLTKYLAELRLSPSSMTNVKMSGPSSHTANKMFGPVLLKRQGQHSRDARYT